MVSKYDEDTIVADIVVKGNSKLSVYQIKNRPKDVIVLVPGTMDPVNIIDNTTGGKPTSAATMSNKDYFKHDESLQEEINKCKSNFNNVEIFDGLEWSGDNKRSEREDAGKKLKELLLAKYDNKIPVVFHFIAHSHGGMVVNEFAMQSAQDAGFPKLWKIKSITYLSTPYFNSLHNLQNEKITQKEVVDTVFHKQFEIINVRNKYDLTQRFVANFSMFQMPSVIAAFSDKTITDAIKDIKDYADKHKDDLAQLTEINLDYWEGKAAFPALSTLLKKLVVLIGEINKVFRNFYQSNAQFDQKAYRDLSVWLVRFSKVINDLIASVDKQDQLSRSMREDFYNRLDLNFHNLIDAFYEFIQLDANMSSELSRILDQIIFYQMEFFDNTRVLPPYAAYAGRVKDFEIDIYDSYDFYNRQGKKFDKFMQKLEALESEYEKMDGAGKHANKSEKEKIRYKIILLCIAQYNRAELNSQPAPLQIFIDKINFFENFFFNKNDAALKRLKAALGQYNDHFKNEFCDIIHSWSTGWGTIPYLAMNSHSLSHNHRRMNKPPEIWETVASNMLSGDKKAAGFIVEEKT